MKLEWSGTFANDKAQADGIYNEMRSCVEQIRTLVEEAKTYWKDDNDPKGNTFKAECETCLVEIQKQIDAASRKKDELLDSLNSLMSQINGSE